MNDDVALLEYGFAVVAGAITIWAMVAGNWHVAYIGLLVTAGCVAYGLVIDLLS